MSPSEEAEVMNPDDPHSASGRPIKYVIVVLLCLLGPIIGLAVWLRSDPVYQSEAKLLIRYVIDRSLLDGDESRQDPMKDGDRGIDAEIEILTSRGLALQVAEKIGSERLISDSSSREQAIPLAANVIQSGLEVARNSGSTVFVVRFRCAEPDLAEDVVKALIDAYFEKHLKLHRGSGRFDEVMQHADQVRTELRQIEDELRKKQEDPETDALTLRSLEERSENARAAYQMAQEALGKVSTDDAMDPSTMPNISIIQRPTTAVRVRSEWITILAIVLAVSGPVLGVLYGLVPSRRRS